MKLSNMSYTHAPHVLPAREALTGKCLTLLKKYHVHKTSDACKKLSHQCSSKAGKTKTPIGRTINTGFQTCLTKEGKETDQTGLKIGCKLPQDMLTAFQTMWLNRCDKMKQRKLLINFRTNLLPVQGEIPFQGLTEYDYIRFAEAWELLHKQKRNALSTPRSRREAVEQDHDEGLSNRLRSTDSNTDFKSASLGIKWKIIKRCSRRHRPCIEGFDRTAQLHHSPFIIWSSR